MTAWFGDRRAEGVLEVAHSLDSLTSGFWGLVVTFEGDVTALRYASVTSAGEGNGRDDPDPDAWPSIEGEWSSSLDHSAYVAAVGNVRDRIQDGTTYQVNVCRILTAEVAGSARVRDLGRVLAQGNPAPYACTIDEPDFGVEVACASPELYLERSGKTLRSGPIKGTATSAETLLTKDFAENVMIVDLVRNDIAQVCRPGTVGVDHLCRVEHHPGLVHLVSDVSGQLTTGTSWAEIFGATFPPGSVSGAPKFTALQAIRDLEPASRGPYCGAIGWVDIERGEGQLAVGIRTFWITRSNGRAQLSFGTGAGITWGSEPESEWRETELKARGLVRLASGGKSTLGH